MVNLLGATLPDRKLVKVRPDPWQRTAAHTSPCSATPSAVPETDAPLASQIALLAFYGVNHHTSARIMARLQFHDQMRVQDLSEPQLNALSALLSAPAAAPRPSTPLLPFSLPSSSSSSPTASTSAGDLLPRDPPPVSSDPLPNLVLEEDLKRARRADIAHHRSVGTLRGRQHAMGLPVRGQRNRTNAKTAKKLNRIERRVYSTAGAGAAHAGFAGQGCVAQFPSPRALLVLLASELERAAHLSAPCARSCLSSAWH